MCAAGTEQGFYIGGNKEVRNQPERLIIISLVDVGLRGILITRDTFTQGETKIPSIPLNRYRQG